MWSRAAGTAEAISQATAANLGIIKRSIITESRRGEETDQANILEAKVGRKETKGKFYGCIIATISCHISSIV